MSTPGRISKDTLLPSASPRLRSPPTRAEIISSTNYSRHLLKIDGQRFALTLALGFTALLFYWLLSNDEEQNSELKKIWIVLLLALGSSSTSIVISKVDGILTRGLAHVDESGQSWCRSIRDTSATLTISAGIAVGAGALTASLTNNPVVYEAVTHSVAALASQSILRLLDLQRNSKRRDPNTSEALALRTQLRTAGEIKENYGTNAPNNGDTYISPVFSRVRIDPASSVTSSSPGQTPNQPFSSGFSSSSPNGESTATTPDGLLSPTTPPPPRKWPKPPRP